MQAISMESLRSGLDSTFAKVGPGREPVLVTRDDSPSVVVMSEAEYRAVEETAYLLSNPANANRLAQSVEEERTGRMSARELSE